MTTSLFFYEMYLQLSYQISHFQIECVTLRHTDNIYTNALEKDHSSGILIPLCSDHQMYFSMINLSYTKSENATKFIEVEVCIQD